MVKVRALWCAIGYRINARGKSAIGTSRSRAKCPNAHLTLVLVNHDLLPIDANCGPGKNVREGTLKLTYFSSERRGANMTNRLKFLGTVASLALAQAVSAQQNPKPLSTLSGTPVSGTILCRDGSKVDMTVDAEQALPLQVVAQLDCGQPVSLLSSSEGYTVKLHTADGKTGYVAWMNVAKGEMIAPTRSVRQPAVIKDGKVKWLAGTEGSKRLYSEGLMVESLTVNGVTVQVSLQDTGWKLLANIAVDFVAAQL